MLSVVCTVSEAAVVSPSDSLSRCRRSHRRQPLPSSLRTGHLLLLLLQLLLLNVTVTVSIQCCGGSGDSTVHHRRTHRSDVEQYQLTKVAVNLLKALRLDEPPDVPSPTNLDDIRRMVRIEQGQGRPHYAAAEAAAVGSARGGDADISSGGRGGGAAAAGSSLAARMSALLQGDDAEAAEQDSILYVRGERGPDGTTLVFSLGAQDRQLRLTALRLFVAPGSVLTTSAANVSSASSARGAAASQQYDSARQLQGLKVDVIHRDAGVIVKTERVPSSTVRAAHNWYRVALSAQAVGGPLIRDGRVELRLMCTNCRGGILVAGADASRSDSRQPAARLQQQQSSRSSHSLPPSADGGSPAYLLLVGRKPTVRPAAGAPGGGRQQADACEGGCCLRELTVDFEQLGERWNWILKPRRFQANYCWGSCGGGAAGRQPERAPATANRSSTSAVLAAMLQHMGIEGSPSCCVPTSTVPVEVLYVDSDGAVRLNRNGLSTVTSCSCS